MRLNSTTTVFTYLGSPLHNWRKESLGVTKSGAGHLALFMKILLV